jgi:hypothetical protein
LGYLRAVGWPTRGWPGHVIPEGAVSCMGHGLDQGMLGAAWTTVALVGSCELLMMVIRGEPLRGLVCEKFLVRDPR